MKAYVVGVGNVNPLSRASRKAVKYISTLQGLLGVTPYYPHGTAIIFDTLNNAKIAKNLMEAKGIQTGREIGEVDIDEKHAKKGGSV